MSTISNPSSIPTRAALADADRVVLVDGTTGQTYQVSATAFASLLVAEALSNDQGAAVADAAALTAVTATGGDAPTEGEYNALLADVTEVRAQLNALLASLRAANLIAT